MTMVALLSMTVMVAQTTDNANRKPKKMSHEEMTTQMTSKLKLTDAQKSKVAALNKEYQDYLMPEPPQQQGEKTSAKKANAKTDSKQAGQKTDAKKKPADGKMSGKKPANGKPGNTQDQAKRQEYEKKLKAILSDDQYKSYQSMGPQRGTKGNKNAKKKEQK